jgi:hypothetical protein
MNNRASQFHQAVLLLLIFAIGGCSAERTIPITDVWEEMYEKYENDIAFVYSSLIENKALSFTSKFIELENNDENWEKIRRIILTSQDKGFKPSSLDYDGSNTLIVSELGDKYLSGYKAFVSTPGEIDFKNISIGFPDPFNKSNYLNKVLSRKQFGDWSHVDLTEKNIGFQLLTVREKNKLIKKVNEELAKIKNVRFVLSIEDAVFIRPKVLDGKNYHAGVLLTQAKLYGVEKGTYYGQELIVTNNDDSTKLAVETRSSAQSRSLAKFQLGRQFKSKKRFSILELFKLDKNKHK